MRDIGGEAFIRVDPRPERARRRLEVPRQHADLILPGEQPLGHAAAPPLAFPHRRRGAGELQDRRRQRARQVEGQQHRQHQRDGEQRQDGDADIQQPRIDLPRFPRQQHDADGGRAAPRGFGDGDQQAAIRGAPDIGADAAFQRQAQFLPPVGAGLAALGAAEFGLPVEGGRVRVHIDHHLIPRRARQQIEDAVVEAGDGAGEGPARLGGRQGFRHDGAARAFAHAAVGDHQAGIVEQPGLGVGRWLHQAAQQGAGGFGHQDGAVIPRPGRGLPDGGGVDAGLGAQRLDLRRQQSVLVLVEVEQRRRQQRRRQGIEQQDAAQQRREPGAARLAFRGGGRR